MLLFYFFALNFYITKWLKFTKNTWKIGLFNSIINLVFYWQKKGFKMKKTSYVILSILGILLTIFLISAKPVFATETEVSKTYLTETSASSSYVITSDDEKKIYGKVQDSNNVGGKIFGIVQFICYGVAVVIVILKGVRFMSADPSSKADVKKELIYVAVGAVILFAIGSIVRIVGEIAINSF